MAVIDIQEKIDQERAREVRKRLKLNYTPRTEAEKRELREYHRETLDAALARLGTAEGMSAFLISRHIHGTSLTPANTALAALQAPNELVGTYPAWASRGLKPQKGRKAELVLTGKTFWPEAAWKAEGWAITMPMLPCPDGEHCARLAALWLSWPEQTAPGLTEWIETTRPELIEGDPVPAGNGPEIPF